MMHKISEEHDNKLWIGVSCCNDFPEH